MVEQEDVQQVAGAVEESHREGDGCCTRGLGGDSLHHGASGRVWDRSAEDGQGAAPDRPRQSHGSENRAKSSRWRLVPLPRRPGIYTAQPTHHYKTDSEDLSLMPGDGVEIKYHMQKGAEMGVLVESSERKRCVRVSRRA